MFNTLHNLMEKGGINGSNNEDREEVILAEISSPVGRV